MMRNASCHIVLFNVDNIFPNNDPNGVKHDLFRQPPHPTYHGILFEPPLLKLSIAIGIEYWSFLKLLNTIT